MVTGVVAVGVKSRTSVITVESDSTSSTVDAVGSVWAKAFKMYLIFGFN